MIREIINFTKDLKSDFPDILHWKSKPNDGIHVFVSMDENGHRLQNQTEIFVIGKENSDVDKETRLKISKYEQLGERMGTSMNKVFDLPDKKIFSCSPFIVSFKNKSQKDINSEKLKNYFNTAQTMCIKDQEVLIQKSKAFMQICPEILVKLQEQTKNLKDDEFVNIYLNDVSIEDYKQAHDRYLDSKIFNTDKFNTHVDDELWGMSGFCNGLNSKKPFLEHKTFINKISGRILASEAMELNDFEKLINSKTLPNPLPIIIDNREINGKIIKIFNSESAPLSYKEIIERLFESENLDTLSNFYLLNYVKKKGIEIRDIDFVSSFKFKFDSPVVIKNTLDSNQTEKKRHEIYDIFDFERLIISPVFNNSLVKVKEKEYSVNYFGDIDSRYVSGGDIMYMLIMKYRKSAYDYIYKARRNAISSIMFEDIMYQSILSNIRTDDVKGRFSWNGSIKRKLDIWFSLYNLFNNSKDMASKVEELISKSNQVAKGEAHLDSREEFAFAAGQIVSYLIDRSAATNKTYSLLETYLQKTKSGQLQDSIAQDIAKYKHELSTYKSAFHALASDVLTYNNTVEMKPLLKFFLAGCFADCVIYNKKDNN